MSAPRRWPGTARATCRSAGVPGSAPTWPDALAAVRAARTWPGSRRCSPASVRRRSPSTWRPGSRPRWRPRRPPGHPVRREGTSRREGGRRGTGAGGTGPAGTGPAANGRRPRPEVPGHRPAAAPGPPLPRGRAARAGRGRRGGPPGRRHLRAHPAGRELHLVVRGPGGRARGAGACQPVRPRQHHRDQVRHRLHAGEPQQPGRCAAGQAWPERGGSRAERDGPRGPTARPRSSGGRAAAGISASALAGCVNRIAAGERVLLVDVARYQGAPATVIVTQPAAGGPERISVVGTGCSASRSDLLHHAMLNTAG